MKGLLSWSHLGLVSAAVAAVVGGGTQQILQLGEGAVLQAVGSTSKVMIHCRQYCGQYIKGAVYITMVLGNGPQKPEVGTSLLQGSRK